MFIGPVLALFAPIEVPTVPPTTFPVMLTVPAPKLRTPSALFAVVPVTFPVMLIVPATLFATAIERDPDPAVQFPVIFKTPVDVLATEYELVTVPPVQFPTINPTAGEAAVNCKQLREVVVDLLVTFAVSVTPSLSVKIPVPALDTSSQVAFAVIVTVWPVAARASSPTPGTMPPVHVAPALKLPLAAEVMRAMA
jgi:hypothetical protein